MLLFLKFSLMLDWLVVSTPLKNISQSGWTFPICGKKSNHVPNHQTVDVHDMYRLSNAVQWGLNWPIWIKWCFNSYHTCCTSTSPTCLRNNSWMSAKGKPQHMKPTGCGDPPSDVCCLINIKNHHYTEVIRFICHKPTPHSPWRPPYQKINIYEKTHTVYLAILSITHSYSITHKLY